MYDKNHAIQGELNQAAKSAGKSGEEIEEIKDQAYEAIKEGYRRANFTGIGITRPGSKYNPNG